MGLFSSETNVFTFSHAAGVFLIARCSPIYEHTTYVLKYVTIIGALTSFFAATTGLLQNDLKRVIAYSTCSQLGYMIISCGLSNYSVGFFHLTNHAFLCVVLGYILFCIKVIFATVKRLVYIVSKLLFLVRVEVIWMVKVKAINFIWVRSAKSDDIRVIRLKDTDNIKGLYLKVFGSQQGTTQELLQNTFCCTCSIDWRRPYFIIFLLKKVFIQKNIKSYYNQGSSYKNKCDSLNNKQIKFLSSRYFCSDLGSLKTEIQNLSKVLNPRIREGLNSNNNPVIQNAKDIKHLVFLQQKLLSLNAIKYGIYHTKTLSLANNYLCSLAFRVYSVTKLLDNPGCKIPGIDGKILKRSDFCEWVKFLSYTNVFNHKVDLIKRGFIFKSKGEESPLGIPTIKDRLVQMLYVLTYEPILETVSDFNSFGFRKNRNAHQAIGVLASKLKGHYDNTNWCYTSKIIIKYNIHKFFENVEHEWLLNNFPALSKHKFLLKAWVKTGISYMGEDSGSYEGFPQGSVIGPLLANFILNGLEDIIQFNKIRYQDQQKCQWYLNKGLPEEKANQQARVILRNSIVRYADDLVIVTAYSSQIEKIKKKVEKFLAIRGLKINTQKSQCFKFESGRIFDFLGFTFKYIKRPKRSRLTKRVNKKGQKITPWSGLFVYVSNNAVKKFKFKINTELEFLSKSVFQIIMNLNSIIRGWGNYYRVGSYETLKKIDSYIYQRCFRFIKRKFHRMGKCNIVSNFFLHKIQNVNWNFNVPIIKTTKKTRVVQAVLIRICAVIKFISVLTFRPRKLELSNPFINEEVNGLWAIRITKLRYKLGCSNIMGGIIQ